MQLSPCESPKPEACCVLSSGGGAWAFDGLAQQLSSALWIDISDTPRMHNYLLVMDDQTLLSESFVPLPAMRLAADKRLLAETFAAHGVRTPETLLMASLEEAEQLLEQQPTKEWCLKFPTGCGASGHRRLQPGMTLPKSWPYPLVVQEFIRLANPEVYRIYAAGGHLFGWVARRYPEGTPKSPWVAHARGARYALAGEAPVEAMELSRQALQATQLFDTFGCVDLIQRPTGEWLVLEVGTDGMFNHVDRDLDLPELEREIQWRIAEAFWARFGPWRPWGEGSWRPK